MKKKLYGLGLFAMALIPIAAIVITNSSSPSLSSLVTKNSGVAI